jgi:hypothetical protein
VPQKMGVQVTLAILPTAALPSGVVRAWTWDIAACRSGSACTVHRVLRGG